MQLDYENIIDIHKNKPAIILGHGPSLDSIKKNIQDYKLKNHIIFGCNLWFHYHDKPNYWFITNPTTPIGDNIFLLNNYEIPIFFSKAVDKTDLDYIDKMLKVDYFPFHQYPSDKYDLYEEQSIQERVKDYTNYEHRYGVGLSVALHMIAFSILMGCSPIYISGIDVDYNLGYASNNTEFDTKYYMSTRFPEVMNDDFKKNFISDLKILNDSAKNIGSKLFNLNKSSIYNVIEQGDIIE